MMKFALALLLAVIDGASASGSCACEAEELDFKINCADQQAMDDAFSLLRTNGCASDCSSALCEKNYYIVQAHHDFCRENEISEEIEDGFHTYDDSCIPCDIEQSFTEGADDCPAVSCEDGSGNNAYDFLLENDCLDDCNNAGCGLNFLILLTVHDTCDHDSLTRAAEEGLHDFENKCQDIHKCNSPNAAANQLVCDDHDHDHSDASTRKVAGFAAIMAAGAFLV